MHSPQYISQQSMDLDIYLPDQLDSEDLFDVQSADQLLERFHFDSTLSEHRVDIGLFDPFIDDQEASSTFNNIQLTPVAPNDPDVTRICYYFREQSTVVPHNPKETTKPKDKHQPSSGLPKLLIFDPTTRRERRPFLHEFFRLLLDNEEYCDRIEYLDRKQGIFRIHNTKAIADLWKQAKGRNSDNGKFHFIPLDLQIIAFSLFFFN